MNKKWYKWLVVLTLMTTIAATNLFFIKQLPSSQEIANTQETACRNCHQDIYDSYTKTAHYIDSRAASTESIKGSFDNGNNSFHFNLFMHVDMIKENKKLVQSSRISGEEIQRASFDIVIGSGRNGQSYLYWNKNNLFQLPISYYARTRSWCNSPGFPNLAYFDRPISLNCLECHATAAKTINPNGEGNEYDKKSIVLGIGCQKCHGEGSAHISHHIKNPTDTVGKFIVNTAKMERQIRLDGCSLCHSGMRKAIKPPFSFKVGMKLDAFSVANPISSQADTLDVHGNQYGLLAASKCFTASTQMDCSSCHNVHKEEYNDPKLFSQKCMDCHGGKHQTSCTVKAEGMGTLQNNCIDCHMPVLPSKKIQLNIGRREKMEPDYIRTHYIAIYREESRKLLKQIP
ncbi:MAG: cytochrome c3 family protein [bacterium]